VTETKFEQAYRHVMDGRKIVARQREIIARLKAGGADVSDAEDLLDQFERTLAIFESDLAAIQKNSN